MTPAMDAEGWDRRYGADDLDLSREPSPFVVELVSGLDPGRALDLGAGWGRNGIWLATQGWRVTTVDFSRVGLEHAQRAARAAAVDLDTVVADVCRYEPAAGSFDLVLVAYVHPDPACRQTLLAGAAAAVAAGGRLLVLGLGLAGSAGSRSPEPERRYTPERIAGALAGIELDRCESVLRVLETDDGPREMEDVVAWGRRPPGRRPDGRAHWTSRSEDTARR